MGPVEDALEGRSVKGRHEDGRRLSGARPLMGPPIRSPAGRLPVLEDLEPLAGKTSWKEAASVRAGLPSARARDPLTARPDGGVQDPSAFRAVTCSPSPGGYAVVATPVVPSYGVTPSALPWSGPSSAGGSSAASLTVTVRPGLPVGHVLVPSSVTSRSVASSASFTRAPSAKEAAVGHGARRKTDPRWSLIEPP